MAIAFKAWRSGWRSGMASGLAFDKIEPSLIRAFHTVITERNVSRAALQLNRSQPAVSAQLKRLRGPVGDPLRVRAGSGMAATAVALSHPAHRRPRQWTAERYLASEHLAATPLHAPAARSYLAGYAQHGLLTERSVLAHGIWIDDTDRAVLQHSGAQIAFCPSSNLFLGSGLFGWQQAAAAGVKVSLASDVGGGRSLSMLRTMADGYKVQALAGKRLTAWALLHAASRGAAQALRLGDEIGSLQPGAMADLCLWDYAVGAVAQRRDALTRDAMGRHLHERLIAWVTLADDRNLVETWIGGVCRFKRCGGSSASAPAPTPQP